MIYKIYLTWKLIKVFFHHRKYFVLRYWFIIPFVTCIKNGGVLYRSLCGFCYYVAKLVFNVDRTIKNVFMLIELHQLKDLVWGICKVLNKHESFLYFLLRTWNLNVRAICFRNTLAITKFTFCNPLSALVWSNFKE